MCCDRLSDLQDRVTRLECSERIIERYISNDLARWRIEMSELLEDSICRSRNCPCIWDPRHLT